MVFSHPTIKLGDLLGRDRNVVGMCGQVVPELADEDELFRRRHLFHIGKRLKNHGAILAASEGLNKLLDWLRDELFARSQLSR
jgi:hypothetical protein